MEVNGRFKGRAHLYFWRGMDIVRGGSPLYFEDLTCHDPPLRGNSAGSHVENYNSQAVGNLCLAYL